MLLRTRLTGGQQMHGYVAGEQIKALVGKVSVPTRDHQGLPVCQARVEESHRGLSGMKGH